MEVASLVHGRERERFSKGFGFYLAAGEVRGSIQSVLCYSSYIFFTLPRRTIELMVHDH